ncbi:hypothetical protein [Bacillus sp. 123MFChir2]|nr:hypothetical protein [Bacillus sp. 123MFChir2]
MISQQIYGGDNNVIKANFPSVAPPQIKQAKPLEYVYLDYFYTYLQQP